MGVDKSCLACCKELIRALPKEEQIHYESLLTPDDIPYIDELHEGLTYLFISCMELGVLFTKFENEKEHEIVIQRMTIGYLFEVYNSVWGWIGKAIKKICEERNVDPSDFYDLKKALDSHFSKYVPLLKAVRDGSFHTKETGDKDWINSATRLLFQNKVPQILRRNLYEYGYGVNMVVFQKSIYGCYPGIGGFGAIHPSGKINPMSDLYYAGTSIRVTPEKVI
ncbi:MAG: hypothetical protein WCO26_12340 [Deltaproteobacteria bacterium]